MTEPTKNPATQPTTPAAPAAPKRSFTSYKNEVESKEEALKSLKAENAMYQSLKKDGVQLTHEEATEAGQNSNDQTNEATEINNLNAANPSFAKRRKFENTAKYFIPSLFALGATTGLVSAMAFHIIRPTQFLEAAVNFTKDTMTNFSTLSRGLVFAGSLVLIFAGAGALIGLAIAGVSALIGPKTAKTDTDVAAGSGFVAKIKNALTFKSAAPTAPEAGKSVAPTKPADSVLPPVNNPANGGVVTGKVTTKVTTQTLAERVDVEPVVEGFVAV